MKIKIDGFELLIAMAIVALGEFNGVQFEYFPILPKPFCDNLDFQSSCGCNADFLCIRVNDLFKVDVWFADEKGDTFWYGLDEIKVSHPVLYTAIVTHMADVMRNIED